MLIFWGMQGTDTFSYRGAELLGETKRGWGQGQCLSSSGSAEAGEVPSAAEQRSLNEMLSLLGTLFITGKEEKHYN